MEPRKNMKKNEITPTRSNKIRLQPKANVSLRIWNGAVGWLWRLDSMIHPSSQFCWGKWWWNNDETSNVRVFPTIVICNLPIFGRAFERASECASVSQRPIQVEPSVEVHHVFCTTHSPPCLGIFASATHKIGIFGYLGNSQVSSQVIL